MNDKERVERVLFQKRIRVGYTKTSEYDKQRHPVFVEATIKEHIRQKGRLTQDLKPIKKYKSFSISGSSKNFGGQIQDELTPKNIDFTIDPMKVKRIKKVWKEWHLSDLKAGTKEQEKAIARLTNTNYYEKAVKKLKEKRLYKQKGYVYGSAWLVDPLPKEVEKKIRDLF